MSKAEDEFANISLSVPEGSEGVMYIPENAEGADAFGAYKCSDEGKASELVNGINGYISETKDEMQKYKPEEVPKLDGAIVKSSGKYVVFCITADKDKANEVIGRYFN